MEDDITGDVEDTLIGGAELLFPPKPGGLIDRTRQERARRAQMLHEKENIDQRVEGASYKAVKTANQTPETFTAVTYTILPGGSAPVLPLNPYRNRSVIMVITAGGAVVLSKDNGNAISGAGFALPAGMQLVLTTRAQVYALNTSGSATVQVSVLSEIYAPEKP